MRILLFILAVGFFAQHANAQVIVDITRHEAVQVQDGSAVQDQLMNKAIEDASFDYIKTLIGAQKTDRLKDAIENKIIKNSSRYILSISSNNLTNDKDVYAMDVQMRLSLTALRAILLENGLLYQLEGPPKVLPIVQYVDRVTARSYGWWYKPASNDFADLHADADVFEKSLKSELSKIGFYALSPISARLQHSVPEPYRSENLQKVDALFLGEYFKSSIVLRGQVMFRTKPDVSDAYDVEVHLEAVYSGNGRTIAEITRSYTTDSGPFHKVVTDELNTVVPQICADLSTQLNDVWKRGTFGASVIRVVVNGSLSPKQFEDFRSAVVLSVHDIKAFHERIIAADQVTYDADASVLPQQLAQAFRTAKVDQYKVRVTDVSPDGVVLKVKAL